MQGLTACSPGVSRHPAGIWQPNAQLCQLLGRRLDSALLHYLNQGFVTVGALSCDEFCRAEVPAQTLWRR